MFQLKRLYFRFFFGCTIDKHASGCGLSWCRLIFFIMLFISMFLPYSNQVAAADVRPKLYDFKGQAATLPPETIREIFFMRLNTWPDGSPVRVFVLPDDNPLHIRFAKEILGVYPFQLRSAWDRLLYSGTGVSPTTVETQQEMRKRIESTPGAIGYISQ
jgi:hypothetical protein